MVKVLPIGTVVKLNNIDDIKIMIVAHLPIYEIENGQKGYFDYKGCVYPLGQGAVADVHFNNEDISEVIFKGLVSEREKVLETKIIENLNKIPYSKINNDNYISNNDDPFIKLMKQRKE